MTQCMFRKTWFRIVGILIVLVPVVLVALQLSAAYWVEDFLKRKIPAHIAFEYEAVSANILTGSIRLKAPKVRVTNRMDGKGYAEVETSQVTVEGLKYLPLLFGKTIDLHTLTVETPRFEYYPYKKQKSIETDTLGVVRLLKTINIGQIAVTDGELSVFQRGEDPVLLQIQSVDFTLDEVRTHPELIIKSLPFTYASYALKTETTTVAVSSFEILKIGRTSILNEEMVIDSVLFKTRYTKECLSQLIDRERDHVSLQIPKIVMGNIDFGFDADLFFLRADSLTVKGPRLELYRDKQLPDDFTEKAMYGTLLKKMPIQLAISNVRFTEGQVGYGERLRARGSPGRIFFDKVSGSIRGFRTKAPLGDSIQLNLHGLLMGKAPTELYYAFDPNDTLDAFLAKGHISSLSLTATNTFLRPNLGVRAKGHINQLYFTVFGNRYSSKGEMKMGYQDFKFDVLKADGSGVNKILSAIGNIFVNDGSKANAKGFRFGQISARREAHKSFFNYLWGNVREGILSTMTGDGKKENPRGP